MLGEAAGLNWLPGTARLKGRGKEGGIFMGGGRGRRGRERGNRLGRRGGKREGTLSEKGSLEIGVGEKEHWED